MKLKSLRQRFEDESTDLIQAIDNLFKSFLDELNDKELKIADLEDEIEKLQDRIDELETELHIIP